MKKILVAIIALFLTVFTVRAQVFVGGGLGLSTIESKNSMPGVKLSGSKVGFNFSPQVGYYLNDDWAIGIKGYLDNSWYKGTVDNTGNPQSNYVSKESKNKWGVKFFGRYKLMGLGTERLSLLVEVSAGVEGSADKNTTNGATTKNPFGTDFGISACPVFAYKLSNKFDVLAYCDFLTIGYRYHTLNKSETNEKINSHNFKFDLYSDFDLNTLLNWNISLIYKF